MSDVKREKTGYSNQVRGAIFAQVVREHFPKERAFKWRLKGSEAGSHVDLYPRKDLARQREQCKGPGKEAFWLCKDHTGGQ